METKFFKERNSRKAHFRLQKRWGFIFYKKLLLGLSKISRRMQSKGRLKIWYSTPNKYKKNS